MYWTTKEGESIKIKEMDDDHLKNTIIMLSRKFKERYQWDRIDEKFLGYVNQKIFEIMIEDYLDRKSWDRG